MDEVQQAIDALWNFGDPAASEAAFRDHLHDHAHTLDAEAVLQLRTQIARALGLQRRFEEATALLDELRGALAEPEGLAALRWHLERGRVLNSSRADDRGAADFGKAFSIAERTGHEGLAVDAAHMLAIVLEGDEAFAWHERAIDIATASNDPNARRWLGSLTNNLGWAYHDQGRFEDAQAMFERSLAFHQQRDNEGAVRIARWSIARALRSRGRLDEARRIQENLLKVYTRLGEPSGYVHEELGELLRLQGHNDLAQPHFSQAHALLSTDPWLAEHELERLQRLAELGDEPR